MKTIFYTNCQGGALQSMFVDVDAFSIEKSSFYLLSKDFFSTPMSNSMRKSLKEADVMIYQKIANDSPTLAGLVESGKLSSNEADMYKTDYIKNELLKSSAISISMPNIHFEGFHPTYVRDERNARTVSEDHPWGLFSYGDSTLMKLIEERKPLTAEKINEIVQLMHSPNLYSKEMVEKCFRASLEELCRREALTDIKVSKIIETNAIDRLLFHTVNHPTSFILNDVLKQIAFLVGFKLKRKSNLDPIGKHQVPITPSVVKHLGLKYVSPEQKYKLTFQKALGTFEAYIRQY